jgi:hypothetical protein
MKKMIAILGLSSVFGLAEAAEFSTGQVWTYKNRLGEDGSTVLINKVESHPELGNIFHVSIFGVKVKNPNIAGGISTDLPHFPVAEETLNMSVVKLIAKKEPNPEYLAGYTAWKEAFDNGDAGIFTITLADIVGVIEDIINSKQ